MKERDYFYLILGLIGELSIWGQWALFRHILPVSQGLLLGLLALLPILYCVPYVFANSLPPRVTRFLARFGGYWFAFSYYATQLLVPALALWLICRLSGSDAFWQLTLAPGYAAFALALSFLLLAVGTWRGHHHVVRTVDIVTDKPLSRDLTVAFASDIHLGPVLGISFSRQLKDDMDRLRPDLILFGGDIIDGNLEYVLREDSFAGFDGLTAPYGVYAVFGNHDTYGRDLPREAEALARYGIRCLEGEGVEPVPGLWLFGRKDYYCLPSAPVAAARGDAFSLFMEHEPLHIRQAAAAGWDLHVSGHTHAGQYWPNRWVTRRLFALDYGAKLFGAMTAVVSSGYGAWGALFRLGPAPEIVLIRIRRRQAMEEKDVL